MFNMKTHKCDQSYECKIIRIEGFNSFVFILCTVYRNMYFTKYTLPA